MKKTCKNTSKDYRQHEKNHSHHTSLVFLIPAVLPAAQALKNTNNRINAEVCTVLFKKLLAEFPLQLRAEFEEIGGNISFSSETVWVLYDGKITTSEP